LKTRAHEIIFRHYLQMISRRLMHWTFSFMAFAVLALNGASADTNHFLFRADPSTRFNFQGFVGDRVKANVDQWLLIAPGANPGMLTMFELRDREPAPNLVPWAGEFAGKYLISAIQALRMTTNPELESVVRIVVERLIAAQADDGYLGPFRKNERLLGHWDLWGHYHCMLALLMWHEHFNSAESLIAARRAADLVCNTFLDTGKRAIDAGSDEMNLSIIHSLGWLYRITEEPRYLRMIREIEKDWERGGDYLRTGLAGRDFFQTPRPRWESLHSIQGLVELFKITGDTRYRDAFLHHWRSIARWDLRNTGGFSSGEQATGNPYSPTAIETCCTIAWMALSLDALALFGDVQAADLLELATFNAWAGAQHPSGRWCTYNTPMDGMREASAHSIVFQSRHGTSELNCCSVNGPRGWGMLSEWAFQRAADGFVINWFAPASFVYNDTITNAQARSSAAAQVGVGTVLRPEYLPMSLQSLGEDIFPRQRVFWTSGNYPIDPQVSLSLELEHEEEFTLHIRIPEWSRKTQYRINEEPVRTAVPGKYLSIRRKWRSHWTKSDVIHLTFDLTPRTVPGAREAAGKISVYRGPILLAADQQFNPDNIPPISPGALNNGRLHSIAKTHSSLARALEPMFLLEVPAANGSDVTLCDFASAGAKGTRYRSWLPATNSPPAPVMTRLPRDSSTLATGTALFRWTRPNTNAATFLELSSNPDFEFSTFHRQPVTGLEALITIDQNLAEKRWCYWRIITSNQFGLTPSTAPHARFRVDPTLPTASATLTPQRKLDDQGNLVTLTTPISFSGNDRTIFAIGEWPEEKYSVSLRFRLRSFPTNRIAQLFSAWTAPMDDPLRLTLQNGRLSARIESGANYSTESIPLELGRWYDVTAEKKGSKLTLSLDGKERASTTVPEFISTRAKDFAIGGNPHFQGNEFMDGEVEKLSFSGF
jgi:DUF1680 family protein